MALQAEQWTLTRSLLKLMASLARKVRPPVAQTRPKYTIRGAIAEITVADYETDPRSALSRLRAGRQVVVRRPDGGMLFVLGTAVPDPFPVGVEDPNDLDDESADQEPVAFSWLD